MLWQLRSNPGEADVNALQLPASQRGYAQNLWNGAYPKPGYMYMEQTEVTGSRSLAVPGLPKLKSTVRRSAPS